MKQRILGFHPYLQFKVCRGENLHPPDCPGASFRNRCHICIWRAVWLPCPDSGPSWKNASKRAPCPLWSVAAFSDYFLWLLGTCPQTSVVGLHPFMGQEENHSELSFLWFLNVVLTIRKFISRVNCELSWIVHDNEDCAKTYLTSWWCF